LTKGTKDTEKGKIMLLIMHQLIWGFVMTSVNERSFLGVTSSSNSLCPKKHRGLRKYQHYLSSLNKSTVSSFDNVVLLILQRQDVVDASSENGVVLDEESLLFIAGGQDNAIDEDVDEPPIQDLALNVDIVFQADECDAFNSKVDEALTAQTMFMANLSSAYPIYDEVGSSYDLDILSKVYDHDNYQDAIYEHHEVHETYDDVQQNCVVDPDAEYTGYNNMIPYDQYVKDNAEPVVQNNVSCIPNDASMMIINEMHEPTAQCVFVKAHTKVVDASVTAELATYKEQVELYERRAKFELTKREQKIKEQLRIGIT
nr:hypothetical protein [Tanacetum cinerariifolium]